MEDDFEVKLHVRGRKPKSILKGRMTMALMYSHVNVAEWVLQGTGGTAEIEIIENGESRWIEYANGERTDV